MNCVVDDSVLFSKKEAIINRLDLVTANHSKTKSVIEKYANLENINTLTWPLQSLRTGEYDIGLIVAFGHLIKNDVLKKFPLEWLMYIQVYFPRWRGAAPIIYTLLHGDEMSGVTLMRIKPDVFDVGDIISQQKVLVPKDVKLPELTEQLSTIGAEMLLECIRNLPKSLDNAQPQSNEGVTYAKKINKTICEVRWSEMSQSSVQFIQSNLWAVFSKNQVQRQGNETIQCLSRQQ